LCADTGAEQMRTPDGAEAIDVGWLNLRQWRIALVVQIAAIGWPARGRRIGQPVDRECGRRIRLVLGESGSADQYGQRQQPSYGMR
jgi:hypothetical protein